MAKNFSFDPLNNQPAIGRESTTKLQHTSEPILIHADGNATHTAKAPDLLVKSVKTHNQQRGCTLQPQIRRKYEPASGC